MITDNYKTHFAISQHLGISPGRLRRHLDAMKRITRLEIREVSIGRQRRYHMDDIYSLLTIADRNTH